MKNPYKIYTVVWRYTQWYDAMNFVSSEDFKGLVLPLSFCTSWLSLLMGNALQEKQQMKTNMIS